MICFSSSPFSSRNYFVSLEVSLSLCLLHLVDPVIILIRGFFSFEVHLLSYFLVSSYHISHTLSISLFLSLSLSLSLLGVRNKGQEVLLTDTVGFISKLPTDLIAAFRWENKINDININNNSIDNNNNIDDNVHRTWYNSFKSNFLYFYLFL